MATATNLELQETRSKLVSETREKNEIEEQQQQLTLVHENALENLAKTQEIAREMEDEIEVVKSELRGSAGELESFRESLDSAENLIISLQNDLEDMKTQPLFHPPFLLRFPVFSQDFQERSHGLK